MTRSGEPELLAFPPNFDFEFQFSFFPPRPQPKASLHLLHNMQNFLLELLQLTARQPHRSSIFSLTLVIATADLLAVHCPFHFDAVVLLVMQAEVAAIRCASLSSIARPVGDGCSVAPSTLEWWQCLSAVAGKVARFSTTVTRLIGSRASVALE